MDQFGEIKDRGILQGGTKTLTQADLYEMFPQKAIEGVKNLDVVQLAPRKGVKFSEITIPSTSGKKSMAGWRFSNITLDSNDAANWGLKKGNLTLDYLGGPDDLKLLVTILELIGQPKDKEHAGFSLFSDLISVGVFGGDVQSESYRRLRQYQQTPQRELFQRAVNTSRMPILTILAHGGGLVNNEGIYAKTIGNLSGHEKVYLANYLEAANIANFSALVDISCTNTIEYCTKVLPKLLPKNHPPLFGALAENARGFRVELIDNYVIQNGVAQVFTKPK